MHDLLGALSICRDEIRRVNWGPIKNSLDMQGVGLYGESNF